MLDPLQIQDLHISLLTHQQQLTAAESGRRADTAAAEARLQVLTKQMAEGEAALLRRVTGVLESYLLGAS